MIRDLYLPSGYLDVAGLLTSGWPIIVCVGGRGIGKTYSGLDYALNNYRGRFLYLRRTAKVVHILTKSMYQPFNKLNADKGYKIQTRRDSDDTSEFYTTNEDGSYKERVGIMAALSTFSDVRGADLSAIDFMFYDEFIPEEHRQKIYKEGKALLNTVETINRNRELEGRPPMVTFMASNSEDIFASVLSDMGLTDILLEMQAKRINIKTYPQRHLLIVNCKDNPISAAKSKTVYYDFAGDESEFSKIALANEFLELPRCIKSQDLKHYDILYGIGGLYIYRNKSEIKYYVTRTLRGTPKQTYAGTEKDIYSFKRQHIELFSAYFNDRMLFEKPSIYAKYSNMFGLAH